MSFHLYRISELYSNARGTVQFIELTVGNFNGQDQWSGVTISTTRNGETHSFSFPANLASSTTASTTVLIATQGFASQAQMTPDFVLPDGFLFLDGGTLNFGGVDVISYGALPLDGASSLSRAGSTAAATPRNFAGETGSLPALATVVGTAGNDTLTGTSADELIDGLGGNDSLHTGGGNDTVRAGDGDDMVFSGPGNDALFGGDGYDHLYFSDATRGVTIDLTRGVASGGAGADTLSGFELIFGSPFDDVFIGNDAGVGFLGGDGNDMLTGGSGPDHLEGNAGDDVIDGGDGVDTTAYYSAAFAVTVDLGAGRASGGLGNDTLRNIENVVGSVFGDTLTGSALDNRLEGGDGNDTLNASTGNDLLDGGNGIDTATYTRERAAFTLRHDNDGHAVLEKPDATGSDTLLDVERLQFADGHLALDLDGAAGQTAKLLGAVFGVPALANKAYVGIGLSLLDGGMTYEALAALAVDAAGVSAPADVVALLWTHVVGTPPSPEQAAPYVALLADGMTLGALAVLAADTDINVQNIDLVGLASTGIAYTP
jgi:Ca2+-binding RTX toxin-like protein